jgi:small-conductance mechanosensitive channel
MARPFAVGTPIRVRSGALGGEFYGTVTSMSLTYVSILTDEGMLKVPNSSLLAAVGPWDRSAVRSDRQGARPEPARTASAAGDSAVNGAWR